MPRSRGQIIAIVIVAVVAVLVGFVAYVLVAMMGTERKDMAYRGGWDPSAIYKLRQTST